MDVYEYLQALQGGVSYGFTIGSGGGGGTTSGGNGNSGGATTLTIGALVFTASTGQGGNGQSIPGNTPASTAGGGGANAIAVPIVGTYLNLPGQDGQSGYILNGSCAIPGMGGNTSYGAGGAIAVAGGNGANGTGYGSGGGGGYSTSATGRTGGNGADGLILIAEYL